MPPLSSQSSVCRYGTVTGVAQHRWEDTGNKKGFGYIEFGEYEAAQVGI